MTAKICFTMDNLSDAADLGRGVIDKPRPAGQNPPLETGFPAMLDLYEKYALKITHFVEGWNGEAHPDIVADIVQRGHTLGMHGWVHEKWSELAADEERRLAQKATEKLEQAAGVRPQAFRAPGGKRTPQTTAILSELGYRIDASEPEQPGELQISQLSETLWNVPYKRVCVDATHWLWDKQPVAAVAEQWQELLRETREQDHYLIFVWHPHVMGIEPAYLELGDAILDQVCSDEAYQVLTLEELLVGHQA